MDDPRLTLWEPLFRHALDILDAAEHGGQRLDDWSFGGGTVMMRRYRHRVSKDVDIFVPDAQWLGYLTPRLNPVAEEMTAEYVEQAGFLKLYFPQGELDFIVAAPVTRSPWATEAIMGRSVRVELPAEIIGKKLKYRGDFLKARDLLDIAVVAKHDPQSLRQLAPLLVQRRPAVLQRLRSHDASLREDFAQLDVLGKSPDYDECVARVRALLGSSARLPRGKKPAARRRSPRLP